ncbi:MAG: hypothetical protein ACYDC6_01080 [Acidobacteriaceae bacterium]
MIRIHCSTPATAGLVAAFFWALVPVRAQQSIPNPAAVGAETVQHDPVLKTRSQPGKDPSPRTLDRDATTTFTGPGSDAPMAESGVPAMAWEWYRQAVLELHRGDATRAARDAQRAIHLDKKFADAYALAATAALTERNFPLARAQAMQAVQIDGRDGKAWVVAATADNYLGQYAAAAAALGHVRPQDRSTWQVAYQWARAEAGQQNSQQALEWSNRAALTAPAEFAPLHLLRASVLLAVDQYARSADELETYLHLIGNNAPRRDELLQELQRLRGLAQANPPVPAAPTAPAPEYNALAN